MERSLSLATKQTDPFAAILARQLRSDDLDDRRCPRADLLAAYHDQSLERTERRTIAAHISECARCQSMLAAMVRAESAAHPTPAEDEADWRLPSWIRVTIPFVT